MNRAVIFIPSIMLMLILLMGCSGFDEDINELQGLEQAITASQTGAVAIIAYCDEAFISSSPNPMSGRSFVGLARQWQILELLGGYYVASNENERNYWEVTLPEPNGAITTGWIPEWCLLLINADRLITDDA